MPLKVSALIVNMIELNDQETTMEITKENELDKTDKLMRKMIDKLNNELVSFNENSNLVNLLCKNKFFANYMTKCNLGNFYLSDYEIEFLIKSKFFIKNLNTNLISLNNIIKIEERSLYKAIMKEKEKFNNNNFIAYYVLNENSSHWTCVRIQQINGVILSYYYDSLNNHNFKNLIKKEITNAFSKKVIHEHNIIKQQQDDFSCGFFVLAFIEICVKYINQDNIKDCLIKKSDEEFMGLIAEIHIQYYKNCFKIIPTED